MNGLTGFLLPDGGVCFTGDLPAQRMEAYSLSHKDWPWSGPFMQGDARAAVAWPEGSNLGQVGLGVLDGDGRLWIVSMIPFRLVSTGVDPAGKMQAGLGVILREMTMWGIRQVQVQADDLVEAQTWWELLRKDTATREIRLPCDPVSEMGAALRVWSEMRGLIKCPDEYSTPVEAARASGKETPILRALAMLALSYKMVRQARVRPDEQKRWDAWN